MLRAVGLRGAVAINVCAMVGAGPLVTIPLVVTALHGSVSVVVWLAGALVALCDGLVYAELASAFPRTGGTYAYLREAFGAHGPGRFVAFLFVWQYLFWAPLIIASGYVGFAQYAGYLVPALAANGAATHALAAGVGAVTVAALWRAIPEIARVATVLGAIAVTTLAVVAVAGFAHPFAGAGAVWSQAFELRGIGVAAFGAALIVVLYDYSGYGDVTALGEEVLAPARTLPRAIALSVLIVGVAYLALNLGVFTAVPAAEVARSTSVASLVVERAFGPGVAAVVTLGILLTAFASTYGLLVAAARIPFAAARDGDFLAPFARLHPRLRFPHVALAAIGLVAIPASLLPLDALIAALTAGIALMQGAGQCIAVALLRRRRERAPFRIPLFPLPPLIALAGWIGLFAASGAAAIAFGLGTLAVGAAIFLLRAARTRAWPFATAAALVALVALAPRPAPAAPTFGHAAVVQRGGEPVLEVDGRPFFFWGGAFFYERIAPSRWRASMTAMRALGANTLDLYVPWNWHEIADGDFDFDGRTNPRRNLREVLRLGRELGLRFIVRPGPVIRNEWRNGGYPAWLLERPEYAMPLGDVLEGRYPATATLQNAHSDDAAAEWLRNATHLRYAARWLHAALREFEPYADRVLAVQLDDDQAAYIDNQTYPAPNLLRYLGWLEAQAREVVGPVTPAFINTFQMRVPATSPVWTMGNWYQSDAFAIGAHDRAELDFSTLLLATNARGPLAQSEFQAGWLAEAHDPQPRPADPSNTALALHELLALGVHGVVDFPLQDTLAPFGWEAPWANALYAWDAAIPLDPAERRAPARRRPTQRFGATVALLGADLARAHRVVDATIDAPLRRAAAGEAELAPARAALARCVEAGATCALREGDRTAAATPPRGDGTTLLRGAAATYAVRVNWSDRATRAAARRVAAPDGPVELPAGTLAARSGIVAVAGLRLRAIAPAFAAADRLTTSCDVHRGEDGGPEIDAGEPAAGAACAYVLHVAGRTTRGTLRSGERLALAAGARVARASGARGSEPPSRPPVDAAFVHLPAPPRAEEATVQRSDVFEDGGATYVLQNARLRAVVSADGGGRIVAFEPQSAAVEAVDATGALRDDLVVPPSPSPRDYIARYTHDYPVGNATRAYRAEIVASGPRAELRLAYARPDGAPPGAVFEKRIALAPGADRLVIDERLVTARGPAPLTVRSSLPLLAGIAAAGDGLAAAARDGVAFAAVWRPEDVTARAWTPYRSTGTLALTFAPGWRRMLFALAPGAAAGWAEAEQAWLRANPSAEPP